MIYEHTAWDPAQGAGNWQTVTVIITVIRHIRIYSWV